MFFTFEKCVSCWHPFSYTIDIHKTSKYSVESLLYRIQKLYNSTPRVLANKRKCKILNSTILLYY